MESVLMGIRNWSEVWGLAFPFLVALSFKNRNNRSGYILFYVIAAFFINLLATTIFVLNDKMPVFLKNNNLLYNIHSVLRAVCFGFYFLKINKHPYFRLRRIILGIYFLFVLITIATKSPFFFRSSLFTAECLVMLFFCMSFLVHKIFDESETNWMSHPAFLICVGLGFYETVNFFVFLFFYPIAATNKEFGRLTMTIHNFSYVFFCFCIGFALLRYKQQSLVTANPSIG